MHKWHTLCTDEVR